MTNSPYEPEKQPRHPVIRPQPTLCKRGHDLTLPNAVYTQPGSGNRTWCRQCKLATARGRYSVKQATHLKRAVQGIPQNPVAILTQPDYPPSPMKSWPLTSCNELPRGLTPYRWLNRAVAAIAITIGLSLGSEAHAQFYPQAPQGYPTGGYNTSWANPQFSAPNYIIQTSPNTYYQSNPDSQWGVFVSPPVNTLDTQGLFDR